MMKKLLFLLALLTVTTASIRADIVIRCNQSGVSFDDKQIVIEGVYYEFHPASDMFIEYLAGNPTAINISGGYFEVVGHDESLPSEVNLREKIEPYQEDDKKFFSAYYEKQTGDGQIQKTPLNIKFNKSNTDFSLDFYFPVTKIGDRAFYGCSEMTSVSIPSSVTNIGKDAFYDCSDLTSLYISDIAAWLNISFAGAVYRSNPLANHETGNHLYLNGEEVKNLVIPEGIITFGNYAFRGCSEIKTVTIPKSVTSINDHAFYGCSGLTSLALPSSVTNIGKGVFVGCSGLTSLTFPYSVMSIGESAFAGCRGLTSVTIPNSMTYIGQSAFSGCDALTSVTIPNSVKTIGNGAFSNCLGLTYVNVEEGNSSYISMDGVLFDKDTTTIICYPAGRIGTYTILTLCSASQRVLSIFA